MKLILLQDCYFNRTDNILYLPISYFGNNYDIKEFPKNVVIHNLYSNCKTIYMFKSFGYNLNNKFEYCLYKGKNNTLCIYQD
jgi:hypothetical protein